MKAKSLLLVLGIAALFVFSPRAARRIPVSLISVPNHGIQPEAVAKDGVLHLLYFSGDPKAGDLFYVRSADFGLTWSTPLRVNSVAGSALAIGTIRGGKLAVGRNGRVHVAWNGSSVVEADGPMNPESKKHGAPMLYGRLNDARTAFEPERNLMTRTFGLDGGGTVAADAVGNVYVSWHGKAPGAAQGEAGRQVWVAVSRDDGSTFTPEGPAWNEGSGACGCCGMAMFADSQGVVRALYRSATENVHRDMYLLTSIDRGRSFSGRKLHEWNINACPMSSMAFAHGAGEVVGAWERGGQVFFEDLAKSGSVPLSPSGEGVGRKHPRVAVGPDGEILMIWTEGTGWQRGGSLGWQMFDEKGVALGAQDRVAAVATWSFGAVVAKPDGFVILH